MQIRLFTIPIGDSGAAQQEMNVFLRSNRVLEVEQQLVHGDHGACWCFCVRYLEHSFPAAQEGRTKVDYRQVLDEATFKKFAHLRDIRKQVAAQEGVSAYVVFTDEELAALARLEEITVTNMLGIRGIGEKKVERFARFFLSDTERDETSEVADR
ncbi:helicase [Chlorobaculum sp. 24CR]|uniref:HRDC domain-containing protein n=1 Tax=Chlorobaculum sp. 24CR TaxID=2508878 RepID=UPI00100A34E4|nr:HRDC domain-containing protein [Chlorobaculum sp. 24CR]RXK85134.1 helicase [Chlorobaculum sp. 24CR]